MSLRWTPEARPAAYTPEALAALASAPRTPVVVVRDREGRPGAGTGGTLDHQGDLEVLGVLPALYPEWLGDRSFGEVHGVRFPYVAGEMANGIATEAMVIALARAEMLGFFGAAGLLPDRVAAAIDTIQAAVGDRPWGANLIHSPHEPETEASVAELFLRRGVPAVCCSAFLGLTPPVVRLGAAGLRRGPDGRIHRGVHLFAKVSRPEVAAPFLSPAPAELLDALVARGQLTAEEARLAREVPIAEDLTVEADSGGHTDNRPLTALLPVLRGLRDQLARAHRYTRPIRLGAAGGLGTPEALAAAFALGAGYVLTGAVNQAAVESGLSAAGRQMLAGAGIADVAMAPAADMFELGVKLQVLRRGTLFAQRAQRLYDLYVAWPGLEAIPAADRGKLEAEIFRAPLDEIWAQTQDFFRKRNPSELAAAEADPHRKMALVFRWYLGLSSRWAIEGRADRRLDYQIWCGPAMGAFNAWTRGSFLEDPARREVVAIALNLLEGAAVLTRGQQLRSFGLPVPALDFRPRPLA